MRRIIIGILALMGGVVLFCGVCIIILAIVPTTTSTDRTATARSRLAENNRDNQVDTAATETAETVQQSDDGNDEFSTLDVEASATRRPVAHHHHENRCRWDGLPDARYFSAV